MVSHNADTTGMAKSWVFPLSAVSTAVGTGLIPSVCAIVPMCFVAIFTGEFDQFSDFSCDIKRIIHLTDSVGTSKVERMTVAMSEACF